MKYKNTITGAITDTMPMQSKAHYACTCSVCQGLITPGEYIQWDKTVKPGESRRRFHINCKAPKVWPYEAVLEEHEQAPKPKWAKPPLFEVCAACDQPYGSHSARLEMDDRCPLPFSEQIKGEPIRWHPTNKFTSKGAVPPKAEIKPAPPPKNETIPRPRPFSVPDFGDDEVHKMELPTDDPQPRTTEMRNPMTSQSNSPDALLDIISGRVHEKVVADITRKLDSAINAIDKVAREKLERLEIPSIIVKRPDFPDIKIHNVHKQFKQALILLQAGENIYLHGAPGGHKTTVGPQLAEALGVRFDGCSLSEQSPEYLVKGYSSPIDGKYYGSTFVDFYGNGGLFQWSELDAANDNFRVSLNTALDNGFLSTDKGMIQRHKDFYLIGDGNTCGRGAHPAFPSRTAFDAAFSRRFFFLQWEYDWQLAKHITVGLNKQAAPVVQWFERASNFALVQGMHVVLGPSESYKMAKLLATTNLPEHTLLDGILRGLDLASKEKLLTAFPFPTIAREDACKL